MTAAACPKCAYVRRPADTAPAWQCPGCGIAIEKFLASQRPAPAVAGAAPIASPAPAGPQPKLPFFSRIVSAAPDIGTAGLFAWCWKNPLAWHPQLTMNLAQVMLMEFFVIHASVFLIALISSDSSRGSKLLGSVILVAFYIPVAGGFAWANNALWPFAAFLWLLLSRIGAALVGRGPGEFEKKRMQFYWGNSGAFYILFVFVAVLLPVPAFGFATARVPWSGWQIPPQQVICWGFLYFSAVAALKLFENPRSIERVGQPPATA